MLETLVNHPRWHIMLGALENWFHHMLEPDSLAQIAWIAFTVVISILMAKRLLKKVNALDLTMPIRHSLLRKTLYVLIKARWSGVALVLLFFYQFIARAFQMPTGIIDVATQLAFVYWVVKIISYSLHDQRYTLAVVKVIWLFLALHLLGIWDIMVAEMTSIRVGVGDNTISLWNIAYGSFLIIAMLWISRQAFRLFDSWVSRATELPPSYRVLSQKFFRIIVICLLVIIGLNSFGVGLQSLAIFSGALGVGLGFGMQKIVSNFISGIILLADKSIKPGDVIAVGGFGSDGERSIFGWVRTLGARYVSIITRDGKEFLIPNENLITQEVENWSHSNNNIRLKIPLTISYDSDPETAMDILLNIAREQSRVVNKDQAAARITGLGDFGVDLELRCWISDPVNGVVNVRSTILSETLKRFAEHNIAIPYPIYDIRMSRAPKMADSTDAITANEGQQA